MTTTNGIKITVTQLLFKGLKHSHTEQQHLLPEIRNVRETNLGTLI